MSCVHLNFSAIVGVGRLTEDEKPGSPVKAFTAEIRVHCADCGKPFQFLGLQPGHDSQGARVSIDGLEARMAISPEGEKPNPFQRMAYDIKGFNG